MATVRELRERLRKPLKLELASGCQDKSVVGGLEQLLSRVGAPFAEVREVMAGYGSLEPEERPKRVAQALRMLEKGEEASAGTGIAAKHTRASDDPLRSCGGEEWLDEDLGTGPDLGAHAARKLGRVGIRTYRDLLHYYPRRYEDRRTLPRFAALANRESATVTGTLLGKKVSKSRRGMVIIRALLADGSGGRLDAVWFNQPWLEGQLFPGTKLIVSGRVKWRGRRAELHVQYFEVEQEAESLSIDRIAAIYPGTQGLSQAYLRRAAHRLLGCLRTMPDHLPRTVIERFDLAPLDTALRAVHFPEDESSLARAIRRLKFDEFLFLELRVLLNRDPHLIGKRCDVREADVERFCSILPFEFTKAQQKALSEILADMRRPRQMARLLQGDVGSGKTAVAAAAIYVAVQNDYQAALMAPTEILARQHHKNLARYLEPLRVRVDLLVGKMGAGDRESARRRVSVAEADVAVGTHALIQEGVGFTNLGLAVIDEEHRFGVEQRRKLLKGLPDVLVMSATPIPRSLALTYYGDLDLSVIDELPPGREPVSTQVVGQQARGRVYSFAATQIAAGRQAYVVAPLIEDADGESASAMVSASRLLEELSALMPKSCRLALLHGRMTGGAKDEVMERFRARDIDMLVATTVVEVGVDVANATVMIIENAERFGLSQLHQLRGRVGRGAEGGHCFLVCGDATKKTRRRLEVVEQHSDGFTIAEKDLELRGPGEVRGTRQSGVPDLVLGDLTQDGDIIEQARGLAKQVLRHDPKLEAPWARRLAHELKRRTQAVSLREIV